MESPTSADSEASLEGRRPRRPVVLSLEDNEDDAPVWSGPNREELDKNDIVHPMPFATEFIAAVVGLFYLIFLGLFLLGLYRGAQSGRSWPRILGRVQSFGVSKGIPDVTYTFEVNGRLLTGRAFVPGPIAKKSAGMKLPKSAYLHEDGRMKFEPGSDIDVFYNPADPEDAVLIPGVQRSSWIGCLVMVLLPIIAFWGWSHNQEISNFFRGGRHRTQCFGVFFFLAGILPVWFGIGFWRRAQKVLQFKTTRGRLLNAAVVRSSDEGSNYQPSVSYEYEVDGRLFQSTQWSSLPSFSVGRSMAAAQAQIDDLQADPQLTVHYDPTCPWDAFLRPGPTGLAVSVVILMALAFWAVAAVCLFIGK